jgi:heme A synthase
MSADAMTHRRESLDRSLNRFLLVLAAEFAIGMWLNLFGKFPSGNSYADALTFGRDPVLALHIAVGVFLFLWSLGLLVQAWRDPHRTVRYFALVGTVAILVTGLSGSGFVLSGYSNNVASFAMAMGLLVIVSVYYEALVVLRSHPIGPLPGAPTSP